MTLFGQISTGHDMTATSQITSQRKYTCLEWQYHLVHAGGKMLAYFLLG